MKTTTRCIPMRKLLLNNNSQLLMFNSVVRNFSTRSEITLNQNNATPAEEVKPVVAQARPKKKYINKILDKPLEKPLKLWFKQDKWSSDEQKRIEYIARLLMKFQYMNHQDFLETNPKQKSALEQIEELTLRDDKIIQKLLESEIKEKQPKKEDEEDVPVLKFNKEALSKIDPDEITPMAALKSIKKRKLANRTIQSFPQNITPKSETEAQYAQLRLIDLLEKEKGWKLAGWKIGATQPKALVRLNIKQAFLGPIFEHQILKNPEIVKVEDITNFCPMVEMEFGFVLAKDLKARAEPYTKEELIDALDHVKGVVEIIGTRVDNVENNGGVFTRIADLGGHINLIIPEKPSTFDKTQVEKLAFENVELFFNGESDTKAKGSYVCNGQYDPNETKGPLDTCLQCVNRITGEFGRDVLAGQIISSGTMTGKSRELEKGDLVKATFENPLFDDIVFKYK